MKMNRYTLLMAAFPFALYACGDDSGGGGGGTGGKKDAGTDSGKGGTGGTAATGGVGALGGTGGSGLTGGTGGSTGGTAGAAGSAGSAGAAGGGGTAGTAGAASGGSAGTDGGVAGSSSGGSAGADASVGGSAGSSSGGSAGTDGGTSTLGDTCANPFLIGSVPFASNSTTVGATSDYGFAANACPPVTSATGSAAPDQVYSFTPTVAGKYLIQLTGQTFDSALYVATNCATIDTTCLAGDDAFGNSAESVTLDATANTTYYIFVDGWQTSGTPTGGAYTLQVDPIAPPTNDTCANATAITTVPFYQVGDTTNAASDYGFGASACAGVSSATGSGANDLVYSFTPTTSGTYIASVGTTAFDAAVYVATDCSMIDATCLGASDSCGSSCVESRAFTATAGTTYYLFVDGWQTSPTPSNSGMFAFSLTTPPPGDTCGTAIPVTSLPFSDSGNTSGALNDYGYSAGSCPPETGGWGSGSNDIVYSFTPTVTGSYTMTLGGFDSTLYVVTNCADIDNSCVGGDESCLTSCDETVTVTLTAGTTYYIIVDGYDDIGNEAGPYQLDIVKNP